jgi:hypothetical protein
MLPGHLVFSNLVPDAYLANEMNERARETKTGTLGRWMQRGTEDVVWLFLGILHSEIPAWPPEARYGSGRPCRGL